MSYIETKSEFHLALNGVGLVLQGAPERLAYKQDQSPLYNTRFGQGDRSYSDFSFWWFWAQKSFAGYKQDRDWEDDGLFFDSEGINLTKNSGKVALSKSLLTNNTIAKSMEFYHYGEATGTGILVGRNVTDQKMSARAIDGTVIWEDSTTGANEKIYCTGEFGNGSLYIGTQTVGSGASLLKTITSGGVVTDVGTFSAASILNLVPYHDGEAMIAFTSNAGIYSFDRATGTPTQLTTGYPYGLTFGSFSFGLSNGQGAWLVGDKIYFLLFELSGTASQLWAYDISADSYQQIWRFGAGINPRKLIEFNTNIYIFDTNNTNSHLQIWKYTTATGSMERIHEISHGAATSSIVGNPVKDSESVFFIVFDGTDNQVWIMDAEDRISSGITPPAQFASSATMLAMGGNGELLIALNGASNSNRIAIYSGSGFITTGFVTTSVFDGNIPALDKLFYDVVINFDTLASGQAIQVLYSIDGGSNFTSLGTASFSVDGAITSKSFLFGDSVVTKEVLLKFVLTGSGTTTPVLNSYSSRYVPFVNYTKLWNIRINAGDNVKRLNGRLVEKTGRELRSMLEKAWWTKSILDYQDLDYATTLLNGALSAGASTITVDDTSDFPEQGRLLIDNEQCFYTGKTPTTFTGVTRAARETRAAAHSDNAVVNNAYKVIITNLAADVPVDLQGRQLEYTVDLQLREV